MYVSILVNENVLNALWGNVNKSGALFDESILYHIIHFNLGELSSHNKLLSCLSIFNINKSNNPIWCISYNIIINTGA